MVIQGDKASGPVGHVPHFFISITVSGLPAAGSAPDWTGQLSCDPLSKWWVYFTAYLWNQIKLWQRTSRDYSHCSVLYLPDRAPSSYHTHQHYRHTGANSAREKSGLGETKLEARTGLKNGPSSLLATIRSLHSITLYSVFPWISAQAIRQPAATAGYWTTGLMVKGNLVAFNLKIQWSADCNPSWGESEATQHRILEWQLCKLW